MKNYRITVNGVAYDVAVEELGAGEASAAPVSTPAAVPAPAKKAAPKTSGNDIIDRQLVCKIPCH